MTVPPLRPMLMLVGLLLTLTGAPAAHAADPKVTLGDPYTVVDAAEKFYFNHKGTVITVKVDGDEYTIQTFAAGGLALTTQNEYDDFPRGHSREGFVELGGRLYLFYSLWDKKNELEQLFYREIDTVAGTFPGPGVSALQVEGKVTGALSPTGFYSYAIKGKFEFFTPKDKSKVMVRYRKKPETRDDSESHDIIGLWVFGEGMAPAWHREVVMPYTEEKMDFWDEAVDSEGNAYILAKVREGEGDEEKKKAGKDKVPNYHAELLRLDASATEFLITPFDVGDKFVSSVGLYEGAGKGMVCAGIYNKGKVASSADGLFTVGIDKKGGLGSVAFHEIPLEVLQQYASAREARRAERKEEDGNAELASLQLRWMILDKDGSVTLIGEQHYVIKRTTVDSKGRTQVRYEYHYDDMLVARVSPKGSLEWMRRLPKTQFGGAGRGGMSFATFHAGTDRYLVFLDNLKNLDLAPDQQPAVHVDGRGGFLTAYKIDDATGTFKRLSLLDTRDVEGIELFQLGVNRIIQTSESSFVMEAYKKKKEDVLVRVTLD